VCRRTRRRRVNGTYLVRGHRPPLAQRRGRLDLSITYLGLPLAHPFGHLDTVKRLEDTGGAVIVLHSLFEEQITQLESGLIHQMDPLDPQLTAAVSYFPQPEHYALSPDAYLEPLHQVKRAVKIPVIGSLNAATPSVWLKFARMIEQADADAVELEL
jgi:dihydroorotate dehydrogenase (fumarate)